MIKKNDWFAASLFQPDLSIDDFYQLGITPDNTEIKSKDVYKNINEVINAFTNDKDVFDESAFDTFYDNVLSSYNKYSKTEFDKKIVENYEWDPNDWMSPVGAKTRDVSSKFVLNQRNPTKLEYGIENLGLKSSSQFSNRELAQMNEVRDEKGNKLGYTPNEKGGLFKSLSRPTLVLAQYEEDTIEEVDGRQIIHAKGELKLDEYGMPYYEELGDREIYGKDVLHYTDTFTEDGSKWNKYDFFDSDGLDKSIGGTIAKTAFKIAPYFIPYVNYAWAGINAGLEIAQLLPVLGKAVNGIVSNNNENELGIGLTKWESYLERFESSVSDYSREKMITTENFGNLISDISGQLWQQRAISSIPKILEKTGLLTEGSKNIKLGQQMALGYMAATSALESYSTFKEAGATDRTAGLAMIGNMIALNTLMQNEYFKSSIFRGGWLDDDSVRRPAWGVAKSFKEGISEVNDEVVGEVGKKKFLSKVTNLFTKELIPSLSKSEFARASVSEGVEEVMEEIVLDVSKAFTEGLSAIGLGVSESDKLNFGWSLEDVASRYGMAFVGGTIGGALFQANKAWETRNQPKIIKELEESDIAKLTYLIAQNRGTEIRQYYKKLHDKGLLGDSNLSASKLRTTTNIEGRDETVAESAEKGMSQNDIVYEGLLRHIDYIENILKSEKFAIPDSVLATMALNEITPKEGEENNLLKAQVLNLSLVNSGFFNEFNRLAARTVKVRAELEDRLNSLKTGDTSADKETSEKAAKSDERINQLTEELKALRKRRDEILKGKWNWYYGGQGLFVLDENTNRHFMNLTKERFAEVVYKKSLSDLTQSQLEQFEQDWQDYQNTEGKKNAYRAYDVYTKLGELTSEDFKNASIDLEGMSVDSLHGEKTNLDKYVEKSEEYNQVIQQLRELESKENRTDEDSNLISDLRLKVAELAVEINELGNRTNSLLRGEVAGEPVEFNEWNATLNSLDLAKNYILSLYNDFSSKNMVMRSEDELNSFYDLVRSNPLNARSTQDRINAYMSLWTRDSELISSEDLIKFRMDPYLFNVNKNPDDPLLSDELDEGNPHQAELANILRDLESAIGNDYDKVQRKLQEAIEFIQEHTSFTPEQALKVVKSLLMKVGNESILDVLKEIEQARSKVRRSPIYDILSRFKTNFSDGTLDIVSMLNSEVNKLANAGKISEYLISSDQVKNELLEVGEFLNVIKSLINGSYSGLNAAINILRTKGENPILLPELDESTAKLLNNDIEFIQKRINSLLNIASWNGNKKLKIHKETEMKLKPLIIKSFIEPTFVKEFEKLGVNVANVWDEVNTESLNLDYIDDSNWKTFEITRVNFESKLRNEILAKNSGDYVDKLISCFGDNLYKQITTRIEPDTNVMSAYDMLFYLADVLSIDSQVFTSRYKAVLKNRDLAPVFGQELAIRRNVCLASNSDLYQRIKEEILKKTPEDKRQKILSNISFVLGGAGTGKTVAISAISADILAYDNDIEFVYLAPSKTQVDNLKVHVGHEGITYTQDDFNKDFLKEKPEFKLAKDKAGNPTGKINWTYKLSGKNIWSKNKKRRILIMDECSLFNAAELEAISNLAVIENGTVWALGDDKQNASIVEIERRKQHTGLDDFSIIKSPQLTSSLRSSYVGKFENSLVLDKALTNINQEATELGYTKISQYNSLVTKHLSNLELKYAEKSGDIAGEKIIERDDQVAFWLGRLAGWKGDGENRVAKVAYITDKTTASVPDGVELIAADKAQGGEWDYVVVDKKWSDDSYDALRDLYTLTQRSTKGSIILNNGIKSKLNIGVKESPSAIEPLTLKEKDTKEFVKWKYDSLGSSDEAEMLFKTYFDKDFEEKPFEEGEEEEKKEEVSEQEPEKEAEVSANTPSESESKPDSPIKTEEVKKPELPPIVSLNSASTNELDYFGTILFNKDFWNDTKNQNKSLFRITDVTIDEAIEISSNVAGAIKEGFNIKTTNVVPVLSNTTSYRKLRDFFKKANMQLYIYPRETKSIMVAIFENPGTKEKCSIPISVLPSGLTGRYNGRFERVNQPKYSKGEWISLEGLKTKYPWLKMFDTWQVISVTPKALNSRTDLHPTTRKYLELNNGKAMTLVSDNPILVNRYDDTSVYNLEEDPRSDEYKYTYVNPDTFTNIGIGKLISASDAIKYSSLWSNRMRPVKNQPIMETIEDENTWLMKMIGTDVLPTNGLGDRRWQILSNNNCARFLSEMFNEACFGNKDLQRIFKKSFVFAFHNGDYRAEKTENGIKTIQYRRPSVTFKSGEQSYYMEYDSNKYGYNVYKYNPSGFGVGEFDSFIPLSEGTFSFEGFGENYKVVSDFQIMMRTFDDKMNQKYLVPQYVSNQITTMFKGIEDLSQYDLIDSILTTKEQFKHGLLANVAGSNGENAFYENGTARKFIGTQFGYMTDASIWTPSEYTIDLNQLVRSNIEQRHEEKLDFEETINLLKELVSPIINVDTLFGTINSNLISDYNGKLNDLVESVNELLHKSSKDWNYPVVIQTEDGFELTNRPDLNRWLQELSGIEGEISIDFNALDNFKFATFSVSLSNKFFVQHDGFKWNAIPLKSYDSLKAIMDYWNDNQEFLRTYVPNLIPYLVDTTTNSGKYGSEIATSLINPELGQLNELIIKYLNERILKEEC